MHELFTAITRAVFIVVGRIASRLLMSITVVGAENVPSSSEPLIVISNHFSWFDAPLLTFQLPFQPAFLIATESQRMLPVRFFTRIFNGIPIFRGQVDRNAWRKALGVLNQGGVLGVFPEGGINPQNAELIARGEQINETYGHTSRLSGELTHPKPGTALLAAQSNARILPVALIGTEQVLGNLLRLRRTPVTLHIGPAFGPLVLDASLKGQDRRKHIRTQAENLMQHIAVLFPPERRGPYRNMNPQSILS